MTNQKTVSDFISTIGKSDRTCRTHRQKLEDAYDIELVERRGSQYFVIEPYSALWLASLRNDVLPAVGDDIETWCNDYLSADSSTAADCEVIEGEPVDEPGHIVLGVSGEVQAAAPNVANITINLQMPDLSQWEQGIEGYRQQGQSMSNQLLQMSDQAAAATGAALADREELIVQQSYQQRKVHHAGARVKNSQGNLQELVTAELPLQ